VIEQDAVRTRCVGGIACDIARALAVTNDPEDRGPARRHAIDAIECISCKRHRRPSVALLAESESPYHSNDDWLYFPLPKRLAQTDNRKMGVVWGFAIAGCNDDGQGGARWPPAIFGQRLRQGIDDRRQAFQYCGMSKQPDGIKGLRRFLDSGQQSDWIEGRGALPDAGERAESLEQRFKYAARFQKLLRYAQAPDVLAILGLYGRTCIPVPRTTERYYWSVSCLPSTSDKPLVRVNASWMELFTLYADGDDLRSRFIVHLSDFTTDGSLARERLDQDLLERCVGGPGDVGHFFPRGADIFGIRIGGSASIRSFLASTPALRAIRRFNSTHMNRGRNAYQASHSYSVADYMLGDSP
jgi:hypothetical protein